MATNYERGRDAEYRIQKELERVGYTTVRTSGSHGPVDVIAWNDLGTRFIQCKRTKDGGSYKQEMEELKKYPCPPNAMLEFWVWEDGEGWLIQEVVKKG